MASTRTPEPTRLLGEGAPPQPLRCNLKAQQHMDISADPASDISALGRLPLSFDTPICPSYRVRNTP